MIKVLNKSIQVKIGNSGRTFDPIPADKYTVQISDVSEVEGLNTFSGELETLLNFEYTVLDDKTMETPVEGADPKVESLRGRRLWKRMRPVINDGKKGKASWLYKMLVAIEGKSKSQEDLAPMAENPDALIGQQLSVMVNQAPGKDGTIWNNILDFSKAEKKLTPFETAAKEEQLPLPF